MAIETKELMAGISGAVEDLCAKLEAGKSEDYLKYLQFISRFHGYSTNNQMLIWHQCRNATRVAGYRTWERLGFQVAKGSKAIKILAPRFGKEKRNGEERDYVFFVPVNVFDASQLTEPEKVPNFFHNLDEKAAEPLYEKLLAGAAVAGISVQDRNDLGLVEGYSTGPSIALKADRPATNKFLILIHELAHSFLHHDEYKDADRSTRELHAEATAFVVASHFGIENPFSADYILGYGKNKEDLLSHLQAVQKVSAKIIGLIEKKETDNE